MVWAGRLMPARFLEGGLHRFRGFAMRFPTAAAAAIASAAAMRPIGFLDLVFLRSATAFNVAASSAAFAPASSPALTTGAAFFAARPAAFRVRVIARLVLRLAAMLHLRVMVARRRTPCMTLRRSPGQWLQYVRG